jgi:hypothetical protein
MNSKGLYVTVLEEEMRKLLILVYEVEIWYMAVQHSTVHCCGVEYNILQYI